MATAHRAGEEGDVEEKEEKKVKEKKKGRHSMIAFPKHEHKPPDFVQCLGRRVSEVLPYAQIFTIPQNRVPQNILNESSDMTKTLWICMCECSKISWIKRTRELIEPRIERHETVRLILFPGLNTTELPPDFERYIGLRVHPPWTEDAIERIIQTIECYEQKLYS